MTPPRLLADEDLRNDIVLTVRGLDPRIDFVTVREVGLSGQADDVVLDFAWEERRIVVPHDVGTMIAAARARMQGGLKIAGLLLARQQSERRLIADNLVLIANASDADDWIGRIDFLPW